MLWDVEVSYESPTVRKTNVGLFDDVLCYLRLISFDALDFSMFYGFRVLIVNSTVGWDDNLHNHLSVLG